MNIDSPETPTGKSTDENSPRRQPLSENLVTILAESDSNSLTLNDLMDQTQGRGLYMMIIFLSIPFITPIPLPGLSMVLGFLIALLAIRLAFGLPPHLPSFLGNRQLSRHRMHRIVASSAKILGFLERLSKPRHSEWMQWRLTRAVNASTVVAMGALLALPLPPIIPFTNMLPGITIILFALAMMERDGVLIWIGYALAVGTLVYFLGFASFVVAGIQRMLGAHF